MHLQTTVMGLQFLHIQKEALCMKQELEGKSLAMKDTKKGTKGCLISMAKIII